jgi:hypothetical protein
MISRADPGNPGTNHDHVEMLCRALCHHRSPRVMNMTYQTLGEALGCDQKSFL